MSRCQRKAVGFIWHKKNDSVAEFRKQKVAGFDQGNFTTVNQN